MNPQTANLILMVQAKVSSLSEHRFVFVTLAKERFIICPRKSTEKRESQCLFSACPLDYARRNPNLLMVFANHQYPRTLEEVALAANSQQIDAVKKDSVGEAVSKFVGLLTRTIKNTKAK